MISREDLNDVAVLRLAHGKVSALDVDLCRAIIQALDEVAAGPARALILTGSGTTFCAGVDLLKVLDGGSGYLASFLPAMESLFDALLTFPKPAVAALNGHAIAGGCIIACACDHRVMIEGSGRIGIPELAVGLPFPALAFEIVRARLSLAVMRDLVFSGRTVSPAEALQLGLIDEIAPPDVLLTRAEHAVRQLLQIPEVTFRLTKRTFAEPVLERVRGARSLNDDVGEAWADPAVQARVRAYLEKTVGRK